MNALPPFAELPVQPRWHKIDFISDLHLKAEEDETFRAWMHYMLNTSADAVFILGDLFEFWVGDDCATPGSFEARCGDVLRASGAARDVYFMCGNRDFLVGPDFLQRHNVKALADPTLLTLNSDRRYLLTHGDQLCASDVSYQQLRAQIRTESWQKTFLVRPLAERQTMARQMRARSEKYQAAAGARADIDMRLAHQWLAEADATFLIHGHTHRPSLSELSFDAAGRSLTMAVLTDWHIAGPKRRAEVLRLTTADGLLRTLPPTDAAS
ncbi:MAG: UDP-2,3-diacylglucosamine diphosphatase [Burkholderiaceae bacterium]|jgi:UDP-2,3-diacylglucosamine hydrolase|nr:UDP-2,3-diacylglucosamine diphosphatase [Burkholderiaceae bacterium]